MLKMFVFSLLMKAGVFRIACFRNLMFKVYFPLKVKYEDIYYGLTVRRPDLFAGGFILDVGANIGCTTTVFSNAVANGFRVYAFEPEPRNFYLLENCIKAFRNESKAVAVNLAVGDLDGNIKLLRNTFNHTAHQVLVESRTSKELDRRAQVVRSTTLDSFCAAHDVHPVKFVKMDVEGYELPACRGMTRIIAANPGLIVSMEVGSATQSQLGYDRRELLEFFVQKSFNLYLAENGALRECSVPEVERLLQNRDHLDVLASRLNLLEVAPPGAESRVG
jgi:FkbM family methyltransferase